MADENPTQPDTAVAEAPAEAAPSPLTGSAPGTEQAQPYDFRQPSFLTASDLRNLKVRHEEFTRALAARLSIYLRLEFTAQLSSLKTITFQKFIHGMAAPTHLTLFKLEPLRGICILDLPPRLGLTVVDRLLGGPALGVNPNVEISEIEVSLLDQAVQVILSEWCHQWIGVQDIRPVLLGHENNPRFLQTTEEDSVMFVVTLEARLGDCTEKFQIGVPFLTIEPLIQQLHAKLDVRTEEKAPVASPKLRWNREFDSVPVELTAEWNGLMLPARNIAALKVGDVLQLSPQSAHQVQVRLARTTKFTGRLGTRGGKWAIQLSESTTNEPSVSPRL